MPANISPVTTPNISPNISPITKGYGYTANPKHGTAGVQNLPTAIDTRELYWTLMGAEAGKAAGAPAWSADPITLLTKVLIEGRGDAGVNEFNVNNKRADALYNTVNSQLSSPAMEAMASTAAMYPAAALDKTELAARRNIPVERAWNGTGKSAATGKTGQQHADKTAAALKIGLATVPQNVAILDYVTRGLTGKLLPQEHLAGRIDDLELAGLTTGGMSGRKLLDYIKAQVPVTDSNAQKAARMLDQTGANDAAKNTFRRAAGFPEQTTISDGPWQQTSTQRTESEIAASIPAIQAILQQLTGTGATK